MQTKAAKLLLSRFLEFTETEVLKAFASLARATVHPEFIYIPGERKDRILLVAHADTVNDDKYSPKLRWMGDVCTLETFWRKTSPKVYDSAVHAMGGYNGYQYQRASLGADDRAGCAMLWSLQNLGHSLLITTGEESGCKGAYTAAKELKAELPKHAFALEIDRRGDRQAVFYDVSTEAFEEYILDLLSKHDPEGVEWLQELGSSTDIRAICPEAKICGVNLSAGYIDEHCGNEHLYLEAWLHTHGTLIKALAAEQKPFILTPKKVQVIVRSPQEQQGWRWCYIHGMWSEHCPASVNENCERVKKEAAKRSSNPNQGANESPFKLQVFRTGGTKPGEGQVGLRAVGVGGKQGMLQRISKRQCKKFGKYLQGMMAKGAIDNAEATKLLSQAIELRDGLRALVTQEEREAHAAGSTEHYTKDTQGVKILKDSMFNRGGEYVGFSKRCWHYCRGCTKLWYHKREEVAEDRPNFFCSCPVCSPNVVPQLIAPGNYSAAKWGYEQVGVRFGMAPKAAVDATSRASIGPAKEASRPLNESTVCQHYCSRCNAPWKHLRQSITRGGMLCGVGAYDSDCPLHNAASAKIVMLYEKNMNILTGGWTSTLHKPPPEETATGNGSHGAAPSAGHSAN